MPLPLEDDAEYVPPQDPTQGSKLRTITVRISGSPVAPGANGSPGREEGDAVGTKEDCTTEEDHSESPIVAEEQPPPDGRPESASQPALEEYVIDCVVDHGYVDGELVLRVHWYGYP